MVDAIAVKKTWQDVAAGCVGALGSGHWSKPKPLR